MSENEQRCGNCKWLTEYKVRDGVGVCTARVVLPDSCCEPERFRMGLNEGTDCPCFKRKEPPA